MPWGFAIAGAAAIIGGTVSAIGAEDSANATKNAENYNASIATDNAAIANQNAAYAGAAGEAQAEQAALATKARVGGIKANAAAGNIDVNSGSALDVQSSADQLGELNSLTIKSNAARQAYGYETQQLNFNAQSQLDTYQGQAAQLAGNFTAGSDVIGGIGSAAGSYANYKSNSSDSVDT